MSKRGKHGHAPTPNRVKSAIVACAFTVGLLHAHGGANQEWVNATASAQWSPRSGHTSVVFGDKMWLLGGRESGSLKNDVWYSTDGTNWTQVTPSSEWSPRHNHTSAVFDERMWVIGGSGKMNDVWSSSDGIHWVQVTASAPWTGRSGHTSLVFDNKIWVIGGSDENPDPEKRGHKNDVWCSRDGIDWTSSTLEAPWLGRNGHTSVVLQDRMWLIGGERKLLGPDDSTGLSDVWSSQDGVTWTIATDSAAWTNRAGHASVAVDGKLWLIGGATSRGLAGPMLQKDVWWSLNGMDWAKMTDSAEWSRRYGHSCVVYDDRIWVLGGTDGAILKNDVWFLRFANGNSDANCDGIVDCLDLLRLLGEWHRTESR